MTTVNALRKCLQSESLCNNWWKKTAEQIIIYTQMLQTSILKVNLKGVTAPRDIPVLWSPSSSPPSSAWWRILGLPSIPCLCTASPGNAGLDKHTEFLFPLHSDQWIVCCWWKVLKQTGWITFNIFWKLAVNVFIRFQSFLVVSCEEKKETNLWSHF